MLEKIIREAKLGAAIVTEVILGFVTWLLVLGLIPGDRLDFDVLGSLVMIALFALPYWGAHQYVKARMPERS